MPRELLRRTYSWKRLRVVLVAAALLGTLFSFGWKGSVVMLYFRLLVVGLLLVGVFSLVERWPRRLPGWVARWAFQIVAVAVAAPFATAIVYWLTTLGDPQAWFHNKERMAGYSLITGFGILISPWIAMVAVYRDISGQAERQALELKLERVRFDEQALQARMNQLQAQVEPHFLFNTLANIRELVEQGSPNAADMLESLIGYLRSAVPRLHENASTVGRELELVRDYLAIMSMRMPDRLSTMARCAPGAEHVRCPPGAILVLVENAIRHGIDPSEVGGRIDVDVSVQGTQCVVTVADTGVGQGASTAGLGTGLANLQERLRLGYGPSASVTLEPSLPCGMRARMILPLGEADGR